MRVFTIHESIVVIDSDVIGLVLQIAPGGTVRGTLRGEGEEKADWSGLRVSLTTVAEEDEEAPWLVVSGMAPGTGVIKEDGSFELKNVAGGNYQLALRGRGEKFR